MRYFFMLWLWLHTNGCGHSKSPVFAAQPRQADALKVVWQDQYVLTVDPLPIQWISGFDLNCATDIDGDFLGFKLSSEYNSLCVAGVMWDGPNQYIIQVANAEPDNFLFSDTAFAHELWHDRMWIVTGDPDPDHTDPGFKAGGAVEMANIELKLSGL